MNKSERRKSKIRINPGGKARWIGLGIFTLAMAARLVYMYEVSKSPTFTVPVIDSGTYDGLARSLIEEGTMNEKFFWQGFFYPLYLAGVYLLTGGSIIWAKLTQILLGSILCVLVYRLARDIFDRRMGLLAGVIVALYGPIIFFECELLATSWASIWSVVLILLLLRAAGNKSIWIYLAVGICGGIGTVTRATFLPFFAASCIWLLITLHRASKRWKTVPTRAGAIVAGFLLITMPVAALCFHTTGQFSPLPQSGPINLYIGNNPETPKTLMIRPGAEWRNLTRLPMVKGSESESEDRLFFMRRFWNFVTTQPGSYLEGLAHKTIQFLSSRELPRNVDVYLSRGYSRFFSVITWKARGFGFPFGVLLPLAVLGIIKCRSRIPAPVFLFLILYPVAIILVFVTSRYRTPVIPILAIPAAAGLSGIIETARIKLRPGKAAADPHSPYAEPAENPSMPINAGGATEGPSAQLNAGGPVRTRHRLGATATVFAVAAVLLLSSLPGPFATENFNYEAEMHCSVGFVLSTRGNLDRAVFHLSEALRLNPAYSDPHKFLGIILHRQGKPEEALRHFNKALDLNPPSEYLIHYYMGTALLDLGKTGQAAEHLHRALAGAGAAKEQLLITRISKILKSIETQPENTSMDDPIPQKAGKTE